MQEHYKLPASGRTEGSVAGRNDVDRDVGSPPLGVRMLGRRNVARVQPQVIHTHARAPPATAAAAVVQQCVQTAMSRYTSSQTKVAIRTPGCATADKRNAPDNHGNIEIDSSDAVRSIQYFILTGHPLTISFELNSTE